MVYKGRKRVPTIYSEALKALYGTVDQSFFEDLSGFLTGDLGFERNPYDWCGVNKVINGSQCTIVWHVDDLMISHKDHHVVTEIIRRLSDKYGIMMPLTVNRGKVHEHLCMNFNFELIGEAQISMYQYIYSIIDGASDEYKVSSREHRVAIETPAPSNLYEVRVLNHTVIGRLMKRNVMSTTL